MKKSILGLLILASCSKPDPSPAPGPTPTPVTPPAKVREFSIETQAEEGVKIEGTLKAGTNLTADEAKSRLSIAAELLTDN